MNTSDLLQFRSEKDQFFKHGDQSPLSDATKGSFEGLSYFDPNEELVFNVALEPTEPADITIRTTTGDERTYIRVATASLVIGDEDVSVALYSTGHDSLFLPFRDATSGKESYGAGRYIDVRPDDDGSALIDFNYAYAPFCAYSDGYSCALPPAENWLTVPIRAGERVPA